MKLRKLEKRDNQQMKDVKELKLMTLDDVISQIEDGMTLGIGTGSTIELLVPRIAELVHQHHYDILLAYVHQIKRPFWRKNY